MATTSTITALVALAAASRQQDDVLPIVDVHDFTQAPSGSTKKITVANLFTNIAITGTVSTTGLATLASATVTGALTAGSTITMTAATSQIIPGATSFAVRNNANSANNLVILDSGAATFRGTVSGITTLTATTVTATTLNGTLGTAAQPNITSVGTLTSLALSGAITGATTGAFSSNVTVGGTLGVASTSTFGNTVTISTGGLTTTGTTTATGSYRFGTDNTFDIGATATFRPRDVYIGRNLAVDGTLAAGATTITGAVLPGTTATYDLGATGTRWNSLFLAAGLVAGGSASIGTTLNVSGTSTLAAVTATTITASGLSTLNKIKGSGSAPSAAALASAGTGATVTMASGSTDMYGEVRLTSGSGVSVGNYVTVTYATAYTGTAPFPNIGPSSSSGALAQLYVATYSTSGFTVAANTAVASNPLFFTYSVGQ